MAELQRRIGLLNPLRQGDEFDRLFGEYADLAARSRGGGVVGAHASLPGERPGFESRSPLEA
jgi:hypothetical protein